MVEIPDVKSNSNAQRNKEKEHHFEKVVKGPVKKTQSSALKRFVKGFVPEDSKSIKDYIAEEAPGLIMTFFRRMFQNILDTYLPESGRYYHQTGRSQFGGSNTSIRYDGIRGGNSTTAVRARNTNTVYEYENITFEIYSDAKDVLDGLYDCLDRYEKVRVFDLYDLAGVATNSTDLNYGWVDLRGSKIIPVSEGWVIDLPKPIPLM